MPYNVLSIMLASCHSNASQLAPLMLNPNSSIYLSSIHPIVHPFIIHPSIIHSSINHPSIKLSSIYLLDGAIHMLLSSLPLLSVCVPGLQHERPQDDHDATDQLMMSCLLVRQLRKCLNIMPACPSLLYALVHTGWSELDHDKETYRP